MQWNGVKVHIVLLALLVGLASLWGGQWVFNRYNYERPMAKLLGENKDISSYSINKNGSELEVEIKLKKVDNLQETYGTLQQSINGAVGGRKVKITVTDDRDATLNEVYHDTRLAAYEAIERGNFLEMGDFIERRASSEGAQARVFLDRENLYIQIYHENNYLYDIIPRSGQQSEPLGQNGERRSPS
ncbi:MAG: hypothetical protein ACOY46_02145 [Bacillota bacterium]